MSIKEELKQKFFKAIIKLCDDLFVEIEKLEKEEEEEEKGKRRRKRKKIMKEVEIKNVNNSHDNQEYKDEYLNAIRKSLKTGSTEEIFGRTITRKGDGRVHVFDDLGEELEIWTI